MDRNNAVVFSPIKNFDEGQNKRRTDSFSKFLKGPDAFKNSCAIAKENFNEEALSMKNFSSKRVQDKSTEKEVISPSSSTQEDSFVTCPGSDNSWEKVDKSDNLRSTSIKKKDLSNYFVTASYKEIKNQKNISEYRTGKKHASNTNSLQLHSDESSEQPSPVTGSEATRAKEIKNTKQPSSSSQCKQIFQVFSDGSSVQSGIAVSEDSKSKEVKKTNHPSSLNQYNPLSKIEFIIEKIVSDALESQVENLHQLMWSHHYNLLKVLYETKEALEHRHELERETLCKIMETLAEENCQLRNAAFNE